MAIDLLTAAVDPAWLARLLLAQAGVPPACCTCPSEKPCYCQYCIKVFDVDVHGIRIVDGGQEHRLQCQRMDTADKS